MNKYLNLIALLFITQIVFSQDKQPQDTVMLQNNKCAVNIHVKGAEMVSFFDKQNKIEHIWKARKPWKQSAPILFPIVGKLKDKKYTYNQKSYKLKNHGFASRERFKIIKQNRHKVVFVLKDNANTLKVYPFHFQLKVTYKLCNRKLKIDYEVKNTGQDTLYFSIGSHPGFKVPFRYKEHYDDYYLKFQKKETVDRLLLDPKTRLISNRLHRSFLNNQDTLKLHHELFKNRVVILKGLHSKYVRILQSGKPSGIEVGIKEFPYLGIWSTQQESNLVCIEPWHGISDAIDSNQDIKQKKGIIKLPPGKRFKTRYYIKILR